MEKLIFEILREMAKQSVFLVASLLAFYFNGKYEYAFVVGWICLIFAINISVYNIILNKNRHLEDKLDKKDELIMNIQNQITDDSLKIHSASTESINVANQYRSLNDQTDI